MKDLNMNGLMETVKETKVAEKKQIKKRTTKQLIEAYLPQIEQALPKIMTPERFLSIVTTAIAKNPKLGECTPVSLIGAMLTSAQLGLEPNTILGQAYLIPYDKKKKQGDKWVVEKTEAQFQLGYRGMLTLAQRSGEFKTIQAHSVYENDLFDYELGLDPKLKHKPADSNRGEITHFYAMYKLVNGGEGFVVMSKEDVGKHGEKYSQSYNYKTSVWKEHFEAMAHKTVLKKLLKFAPVSTELAKVFEQDNQVKAEISGNMINVEPESIFETEEEVIEIDDLEEKKEDEVK